MLFFLSINCFSLQHSLYEPNSLNKKGLNNQNKNEPCVELAFQFLGKSFANYYNKNIYQFKDIIQDHFVLPISNVEWLFRAKKRDSIKTKLFNKKVNLPKVKVLKGNEKLIRPFLKSFKGPYDFSIFDGFGGKIIIKNNFSKTLDKITHIILDIIKKGSIKIIKLKNYGGSKKMGYLNEDNLNKIIELAKIKKYPISIENFSGSRFNIHIAIHLNIYIPKLGHGEIQIQGEKSHLFGMAHHLFYDIIHHKPPNPKYLKSPPILDIIKTMNKITPDEKVKYQKYFEKISYQIRRDEKKDFIYSRPENAIPLIKKYPNLKFEYIIDQIKNNDLK